MSRLLLVLTLLCGSIHSNSQPCDSSELFREEIRRFFSSIQPMRGDLYISDKPSGIISKEIFEILLPDDTLFTKADLDFIERQVTINNVLKWDSTLIDNRIIIRDDETKSKESYIVYSIPSFSLDFQTCILFVDVNCNLALCGSGFILVCRKRNGVWEVVDGIMTWVS